jgi:predicted adenylyl cyclase CyaB
VPRNVEIKARVADMAATRRLVAASADGPPESLDQTDTFFRVARGRLKLREISGAAAELIYYERPDTPEPAVSAYLTAGVRDAAALRTLLTSALGQRGEITKRRLVYRIGRTRLHLDEVAGLGAFLELEVELAPGEPVESGVAEAQRLMSRLGVGDDALVAEAYVDLLERRRASGTGSVGGGAFHDPAR